MIRIAILGLLLSAAAQDDEITRKVKALIQQLESDDVQAADEAVGGLVKLGEPALPAIKALALKATGDTKLKLEAAAEQIEKNLRRGKAMGTPVSVTMKAEGKPVAAVLEELAKVSGQPLVFKDLPDKSLTVTFENRPFWEALDGVCKAHGSVMWKIKEDKIVVSKGAYRDMPKVFRGNLVLVLDSFTVTTWLGQGQNTNVNLDGRLAWVKGAKPLSTQIDIEAIEDDKGTKLLSNDGGGGFFVMDEEYYDGQNPPSPNRLSEPLQFNDRIAPHDEAEKIAVVSGKVTVKYALDWKKTVSIAKPAEAKGQSHQAGDVTLALQDFSADGTMVRMKVAVTVKGDVEEAPIRPRDFVITDSDGKAHNAYGHEENWESYSDNNGERTIITYALTVRLPEKAQIASFDLMQPTEVEEIVIPFEFKDLPIK